MAAGGSEVDGADVRDVVGRVEEDGERVEEERGDGGRFDSIVEHARMSSPAGSPQASVLRRKARDRAAVGVLAGGSQRDSSAGRLGLLSAADLAAADRGGFGAVSLDAHLPRSVPMHSTWVEEEESDGSGGKSRHALFGESVVEEGVGGGDGGVEGEVDAGLAASMVRWGGEERVKTQALMELEEERKVLGKDVGSLGSDEVSRARLSSLQVELRQLDAEVDKERETVAAELDDFDALASHLHTQLSLLASLRSDPDVIARVPTRTIDRITRAAEDAVSAMARASASLDADWQAPPIIEPAHSSAHPSYEHDENPFHSTTTTSTLSSSLRDTKPKEDAADGDDEVWVVRH